MSLESKLRVPCIVTYKVVFEIGLWYYSVSNFSRYLMDCNPCAVGNFIRKHFVAWRAFSFRVGRRYVTGYLKLHQVTWTQWHHSYFYRNSTQCKWLFRSKWTGFYFALYKEVIKEEKRKDNLLFNFVIQDVEKCRIFWDVVPNKTRKKKYNKHGSGNAYFLSSVHLSIVADGVWWWIRLPDRRDKHRGNKSW